MALTDFNARLGTTTKPKAIGSGISLPPTPASPISTTAIEDEGEGKSVGGFLKNIPKSAFELGKNLVTAVVNPIDTGKALGETALGAAQKLIPGEQESEKTFDTVVDFFKNRYGGTKNIADTIYEDPVGFLGDISMFLGGGAGALRVASKLSDVAGIAGAANRLSKVASTAGKVSRAVDPLTAGIKATEEIVTPVVRGAGRIASEVGALPSGVAGQSIREGFEAAIEGGPRQAAFKEGMRGKTDAIQLREDLIDNVVAEEKAMRDAYQTQLQKVSGTSAKTNTSIADIVDIETKFNELISPQGYNIKPLKKGYDFSNSTITDGSENVSKAIELTKKTLKEPSLSNLDTLQQKLTQLRPSQRGPAGAFIDTLKNTISTTLKDQFEGYRKLKTDYADKISTIEEIKSNLSIGDNAMTETGIKKIATSLKDNNEFRKSLIDLLDKNNETNIVSKVAGLSLNPWTPRGLAKEAVKIVGSAGAGAGFFTGGSTVLPTLIYLSAASPRVVGEVVNILGVSSRYAKKLENVLNIMRNNPDITKFIEQASESTTEDNE